MRLASGVACALIILATGCSAAPPPQAEPPPPLAESFSTDWTYGLAVLNRGDVSAARLYLERARSLETGSGDAQFHRDLAEVRLFMGDLAGALAEVRVSAAALAVQPTTARFTPAERRLFERTLQALQAAATDDASALMTLAASDESPPLADAWYLLGWTHERHGDAAAVRAAYRAYLDRAPMWSFLRQAEAMRQHAQAAVASG